MLIGFKKHSKRKDVMVYTNVTVNPIRNNFDAILQNMDLNKMVRKLKFVMHEKFQIFFFLSDRRKFDS